MTPVNRRGLIEKAAEALSDPTAPHELVDALIKAEVAHDYARFVLQTMSLDLEERRQQVERVRGMAFNFTGAKQIWLALVGEDWPDLQEVEE